MYQSIDWWHKEVQSFRNPFKIGLDLLKSFRGNSLKITVDLFVLHEPLVARRPESPGVGVNNISNHELAVSHSKLNLHVDKSTINGCPSLLKYFKDSYRGSAHEVNLILTDGQVTNFQFIRDKLFLWPLWIVICIILNHSNVIVNELRSIRNRNAHPRWYNNK